MTPSPPVFRQPFQCFATNSAIQCTELYEYCQTLGGKRFSFPSFQVARRSQCTKFTNVLKYSKFCCAVVRCTSSFMPIGCWTVDFHLRPFITVSSWERHSSDRGSRSLCSLERSLRYTCFLPLTPESCSHFLVLCVFPPAAGRPAETL